ncbi:MAG: fluoride efflux transporter CrcB [Bacteroidales bacterium]|nr:fluoride efflux transporter CrcB [Bacteroidales bacterium]
MIEKLLAVAFGGSIGAVLRFVIYELIESKHKSDFPWGTLTVNLLGSLVIGFLWGYFSRVYISPSLRMLIFVGILGSFTTFSTFAFDNFSLIRNGEFTLMTVYVLVTNLFGIALSFAGYTLSRTL